MKCPTDSAVLVMSQRNGVEIDYCPECRGVWLDRGELDKILDRAEAEFAAAAPAAATTQQFNAPQYQEQRQRPPQYNDRDRGYSDNNYRGKKKESWLSDLFG